MHISQRALRSFVICFAFLTLLPVVGIAIAGTGIETPPLFFYTSTGALTRRSKRSVTGGELRKLGEDVSEVLEYVPEHLRVIRHVRTKLSCAKCDCIVQAAAPSRPIERGVAGPGLLAHVLVSKYADHLPLYRQSEIYARHGVELER